MNGIIRYDDAFMHKYETLRSKLEAGDRPELYRYLIESFGCVFRTCQHYWRQVAKGGVADFDAADEETRRELMRPLSHRQYRMIEQAFLAERDEDAICSVWEFLDDCGRIHEKRAMSSAEVSGFSLILEEVYKRLAK